MASWAGRVPDVYNGSSVEPMARQWLAEGSMEGAARYIYFNGWNFYRDPRAMNDGVHEGKVPVCHGCEAKGKVLDATFHEVAPGTDVLSVLDWENWGLMVQFSCACSDPNARGYTFLSKTDRMQTD